MNYFLNKTNTTQESAEKAVWQKGKELIDHPYYSVEWPDVRGVTYGETIFGEHGLCHRHENSWEGLRNPELKTNYNVYVFPLQKSFQPLKDKKLISFAKHFIPEAYKDAWGEGINFKKITEENTLGKIKLSKIKHKRTTLYLDFAVLTPSNNFVTAAGKILILNKKDVFVLFVGPCKKLSQPDYERFASSFRPEGLMEKEVEYSSRHYYEYLLKQKNLYLRQQHCLESVWGYGFHRTYDKNKTLFYEAIIRESPFEEKIKAKRYNFLLGLVEEAWAKTLDQRSLAKALTEEEYKEKLLTTNYKIQLFLKSVE